MDVVITGGGTGGHIYPGLAVADVLRARRPGVKIAFIGTERGLEAEVVPRAGYPFFAVPSRGLSRRLSFNVLSTAWHGGRGLAAAWSLLKRLRPRVVLGTGGYVSAPVGLAALLRRIPLVIQEQNALPGLTNRLLGRYAALVALGSPAALPYFPRGERVRVTGNPIRPGITACSRSEGRQRLGLDLVRPVVLIVGASQGARTFNQAVIDSGDKLRGAEDLQVVLVTGKAHYEAVCHDLTSRWGAGCQVGPGVRRWGSLWVRPYIDDMGAAYAAADLVVSRAGAISIAELTARGVPALLVPYPYAAEGHQEKNALELARQGAAEVLADGDCATQLVPKLLELARDRGRLERMGQASLRCGRPRAAEELAGLLEGFLDR